MDLVQDLLAAVTGLAEEEELVRAAAVSGSLTDPAAIKDRFSDCDAVFFVRDLEEARRRDYPSRLAPQFGGMLIMQKPDEMDGGASPWFTYLMQFDRGRIDLRLLPVERAAWYYGTEPGLTAVVDKDGLLDGLTPVGREVFTLKRPDRTAYENCCNEFWWTTLYVAKGLARRQLDYAVWHLEHCVRPELIKMLGYDRGYPDYTVSLGVGNKYLPALLSPEERRRWPELYALGSPTDCARALRLAMEWFLRVAGSAGEKLGIIAPDYGPAVAARCEAILAEMGV